jgi:hypothetical protein
MGLKATLLKYPLEKYDGSNMELWRSFALGMQKKFPGKYKYGDSKEFSLRILTGVKVCPQRPYLKRFREIQTNVLRFPSYGIVMEMRLNNWFEENGQGPLSTSEMERAYSGETKWINGVSKISIKEHVFGVRELLKDSNSIGVSLSPVPLERIDTDLVRLKNAKGIHTYSPTCFTKLMQHPLIEPVGRPLVIVPSGKIKIDTTFISRKFKEAAKKLFPNCTRFLPNIRLDQKSEEKQHDAFYLYLFQNDYDINKFPAAIDFLRKKENVKARFKIVRQKTLNNDHSIDNIVYDLFLIDGGMPWSSVPGRIEQVLSLDAGHDYESQKSRWASCLYGIETNSLKLSAKNIRLNEQITMDTINSLNIQKCVNEIHLWRDGRFHDNEPELFEALGFPRNNMFAFTKNPKAVLFRGNVETPEPPEFGDAVYYPDGSILMQTCEAIRDGYELPIRIKCDRGTINEDYVSLIFSLCKQPALGYKNSVRLPSPIYWADRVSKMQSGEWLKVVGRGSGLLDVIP